MKIENTRPVPVEALVLDEEKFGVDKVRAFREKYELGDMPSLRQLLAGK